MRIKRELIGILVGSLLAGLATVGGAAERVRDYGYFLSQLTDLDRLPFLDEGVTCKQFSSYDRRSVYDEKTGQYLAWDANGDSGKYLRTDGDEAVMAEMNGPGCIYRIWSANPTATLRIYLDGATKPTLEVPFADIFSGKLGDKTPFMPPLVWQRVDPKGQPRASQCYVPIPYAKSCKVTISPPQNRMYYHIGYQTFPSSTKVMTFRLPLTKKELATVQKARQTLRNAFDASTMPTEAGKAEVKVSIDKKDVVPPDPQRHWFQRRKSGNVAIAPGKEVVFAELKGPAMITSVKAQIKSDDPDVNRTLLLRVYWDGEKQPSIETPLFDFFGSSFGQTTYHSLPMGRTKTESYSYWRMPFRKSARFVLVNEGQKEAQVSYQLTRRGMSLPANTAYFHAKWRRDPASKEFDYPFLECTGRGRFVGAAQFIQNISGGWWGEGDEKVYADGEKFPSTFGTGSEDYYGDAWGIRWFSNPYAGCPFSSAEKFEPGQQQSCYRWHISDNIPFEKSFKITIENYSAKTPAEKPKNDYSSVAYWYQMPGGSDFFQSVPAAGRLVRK